MKNVLLGWATDFSFRQKTASVEFSYSRISMSRSIKLIAERLFVVSRSWSSMNTAPMELSSARFFILLRIRKIGGNVCVDRYDREFETS